MGRMMRYSGVQVVLEVYFENQRGVRRDNGNGKQPRLLGRLGLALIIRAL